MTERICRVPPRCVSDSHVQCSRRWLSRRCRSRRSPVAAAHRPHRLLATGLPTNLRPTSWLRRKSPPTRRRRCTCPGSIVSDGSPITLDMNLLAGKGGRGQLSESGLAFELIQVGKTIYIKGSPAFYKHIGGTAAAQLLAGQVAEGARERLQLRLAQPADQPAPARRSDARQPRHADEDRNLDSQRAEGRRHHRQERRAARCTSPPPVSRTRSRSAKSGSGGGKITFDRWNKHGHAGGAGATRSTSRSCSPPANSAQIIRPPVDLAGQERDCAATERRLHRS